MAVQDPKRRVLAYCYASLTLRPTHACMSEREFARFTEELVFWCPTCQAPHAAPREALQLEAASANAGSRARLRRA